MILSEEEEALNINKTTFIHTHTPFVFVLKNFAHKNKEWLVNFTPCFLSPLCSYALFNYFLHTDPSPALLPQTISTVLSIIPKIQQLLSSVYCSLTCPTVPTGYRVAQKNPVCLVSATGSNFFALSSCTVL